MDLYKSVRFVDCGRHKIGLRSEWSYSHEKYINNCQSVYVCAWSVCVHACACLCVCFVNVTACFCDGNAVPNMHQAPSTLPLSEELY